MTHTDIKMKKQQIIYKIRNKTTGKFMTVGYVCKTQWRVYPEEQLRLVRSRNSKDEFEVVKYTYGIISEEVDERSIDAR